ncbi:50S ribosomal protein L13 [Patescibacteria group bacterium]|nr:50S ribosomal protein L13 [Patescibacteria group bacterium]
MSTPVMKAGEQTERWFVIDAKGQILGRLATQVATLLRGKDQPQFSPHNPSLSHVIVLNAAEVKVTGQKLDQKRYYRHGKVPGSLRSRTLGEQMERDPRIPVEKAIVGMLPKNRLQQVWRNRLHVYPGTEHDHAAQKPVEVKRG